MLVTLKGLNAEFFGSVPVKFFLAFCLAAATLAAQDTSSDTGEDVTRRVTATSQFFDRDFVNVFAFASGIWDSRIPELTNNTSVFGSGIGWQVGGGIEGSHQFRDGGITLSYTGSYHDYPGGEFAAGTSQSLALSYTKKLSRHWSFGASVAGGILSYGTSYYAAAAVTSSLSANPFSSSSRFLFAGMNATYNQTRRLSYVFAGNAFINNYNYGHAFSSVGGSGSASVYYRVTARTTVGGTYTHTYYTYSQSAGTSSIDGGSLSLSHRFPDHWQLDLSGGINRSHSKGIIVIPVTLIFNGETVTGYEVGPYNHSTFTPSFQGVLTRSFRRSSFAVSAGQGIAPGNGTYLGSRSQFANAVYSISSRKSNFGFGASFIRLSSIANSVSESYSTFDASASYGINLARYVSANLRYDFLHYDGFFGYSELNESRITFGLSLSSKSVPLTLF
jgi:hypothetical protein